MEPGTVKCTHGTGTFLDMNIGPNPTVSNYGLNSIIAWRIKGKTTYGLEGYASVTGAAVQWLRDGAELIQNSKETEALALSVPSSDGVYFVPALAGLDGPSGMPLPGGPSSASPGVPSGPTWCGPP